MKNDKARDAALKLINEIAIVDLDMAAKIKPSLDIFIESMEGSGLSNNDLVNKLTEFFKCKDKEAQSKWVEDNQDIAKQVQSLVNTIKKESITLSENNENLDNAVKETDKTIANSEKDETSDDTTDDEKNDSNVTKQNESIDEGKDIFTLSLRRISKDGNEETIDDMKASKTYYSDEEAVNAAKSFADDYSTEDDVVLVTVYAGEKEMSSGDIYGEPVDIYTASSSDKSTTAEYRKKANYVSSDVDYYAKETLVNEVRELKDGVSTSDIPIESDIDEEELNTEISVKIPEDGFKDEKIIVPLPIKGDNKRFMGKTSKDFPTEKDLNPNNKPKIIDGNDGQAGVVQTPDPSKRSGQIDLESIAQRIYKNYLFENKKKAILKKLCESKKSDESISFPVFVELRVNDNQELDANIYLVKPESNDNSDELSELDNGLAIDILTEITGEFVDEKVQWWKVLARDVKTPFGKANIWTITATIPPEKRTRSIKHDIVQKIKDAYKEDYAPTSRVPTWMYEYIQVDNPLNETNDDNCQSQLEQTIRDLYNDYLDNSFNADGEPEMSVYKYIIPRIPRELRDCSNKSFKNLKKVIDDIVNDTDKDVDRMISDLYADEVAESRKIGPMSLYDFKDGYSIPASDEKEAIEKHHRIVKGRKGKTRSWEEIDNIAQELYDNEDLEGFADFNDEELIQLWAHCKTLDYSYDDEVYEIIDRLPNKKEIFAKADEVYLNEIANSKSVELNESLDDNSIRVLFSIFDDIVGEYCEEHLDGDEIDDGTMNELKDYIRDTFVANFEDYDMPRNVIRDVIELQFEELDSFIDSYLSQKFSDCVSCNDCVANESKSSKKKDLKKHIRNIVKEIYQHYYRIVPADVRLTVWDVYDYVERHIQDEIKYYARKNHLDEKELDDYAYNEVDFEKVIKDIMEHKDWDLEELDDED